MPDAPPRALPGSSPHTRGARIAYCSKSSKRRIIPAYAGSTTASLPSAGRVADHPRIRGEHASWPETATRSPGSSPHTRGALREGDSAYRMLGIIPAYAGSTFGTHRVPIDVSDHPRIRGEHRWRHHDRLPAPGSSPHTRGAPTVQVAAVQRPRIIPAYAGSTLPHSGWGGDDGDHPRIRGEHKMSRAFFLASSGSSPHTRGAHLEIPAIPRIAAVIIPVFLYPSPTPQEEADRSMVLLTLS